MVILIVGIVGGVGATTLATEILKAGGAAVGLDLADGSLSGCVDRKMYPLDAAIFARRPRPQIIDEIVAQRPVLLWTLGCQTAPDTAWGLLREVAQRTSLVIDGGLNPAEPAWQLADVALGVSRDGENANVIVRWHELQLKRVHPELRIVSGQLKAAGAALAAELLPRPTPRWQFAWWKQS